MVQDLPGREYKPHPERDVEVESVNKDETRSTRVFKAEMVTALMSETMFDNTKKTKTPLFATLVTTPGQAGPLVANIYDSGVLKSTEHYREIKYLFPKGQVLVTTIPLNGDVTQINVMHPQIFARNADTSDKVRFAFLVREGWLERQEVDVPAMRLVLPDCYQHLDDDKIHRGTIIGAVMLRYLESRINTPFPMDLGLGLLLYLRSGNLIADSSLFHRWHDGGSFGLEAAGIKSFIAMNANTVTVDDLVQKTLLIWVQEKRRGA